MAFWKVWFLVLQLIGLGMAQTDIPVARVQANEFEAQRQAECPSLYRECNNFCYRVFLDLKARDEAESVCNDEQRPSGQGHLVSILSKEENDFVSELWRETNPPKTGCYSTAWIGLKDSDGDGTSGFIWSDGEKTSCFINWANGQPKTNKNQYCAFFREGVWSTEACGSKKRFICKVPL